jgi:DNA-binding CsgD family transcriptional regulator
VLSSRLHGTLAFLLLNSNNMAVVDASRMHPPPPAGPAGRRAAIATELARLDNGPRRAALADLLADLITSVLPARAADAFLRTVRENPDGVADLAHSLIVTAGQRATAPARQEPADLAALLARLPPDTRWLLLLAAADEEMDAACLVRAARASGMDIAALAPAEVDGLVRVAAGEITFPQSGIRSAVYEQAPLAQRREAHLRIAEAAAEAAAYDRAATALVRAAELTRQPTQAGARLVTAAHYAWLSGDSERARQLLRQARTDESGSDVAGERRLVAGEVELRAAAAEPAIESLLTAADELAGRRRELAVRALMRAGEAACFSGNYPRYTEIGPRAAALRRPSEPEHLEIMFEHIAGFTATFLGRYRHAAAPLRRCVVLGRRLERPGSLLMSSAASMLLADHPAAWESAASAVEVARASGDVAALPLAHLLKAQAEYWLGRYAAAEQTCREGAWLARLSGQDNYRANHLGMLAVLAAIRGDERTSRRMLGKLVIPPSAGRMCQPRALSQWAAAVLDVLGSRPAETVTRLLSIADPTTGQGQGAIQFMATPWLVEAASRGPDPQRAGAVLAGYDQWAGSTGGPLVRALSARCHALLAPRGSAVAEQHYREALRLHRDADSEFEHARTQLLFGQELRRSRRPRQARQHLHQARDTLRQLRLAWWAERAGAELRAAGEQVDTDARVDVLTAQQREIARLVARGATNREVAAALFLSPRTVDHHLRNVFSKLGIRSRVELARMFPADPGPRQGPPTHDVQA